MNEPFTLGVCVLMFGGRYLPHDFQLQLAPEPFQLAEHGLQQRDDRIADYKCLVRCENVLLQEAGL